MEQELKELWEIIDLLNEVTTKLKKYYLNKFENEFIDIELEENLINKTKRASK